jgi:hypothetical protein
LKRGLERSSCYDDGNIVDTLFEILKRDVPYNHLFIDIDGQGRKEPPSPQMVTPKFFCLTSSHHVADGLLRRNRSLAIVLHDTETLLKSSPEGKEFSPIPRKGICPAPGELQRFAQGDPCLH